MGSGAQGLSLVVSLGQVDENLECESQIEEVVRSVGSALAALCLKGKLLVELFL